MTYDLAPTWVTSSVDLPQLVETDDIQFQLVACEQVVVAATLGLSSVQLANGAARVVGVALNGAPVSFTRANDTIVFAPLASPGSLRIFTGPPAFSFLNGDLPPGLAVDAQGVLFGRVGDLRAAASFEFTMRIANERHVRDRVFVLRADPTWFPAYYDPVTMAGTKIDSETRFSYHPLGDRLRDAPLRMTLDVLDPDALTAPVVLRCLRGLDPRNDQVFGTLPPGLTLDGGALLTGYIDPDAPLGKYFFRIIVNDPLEATAYLFMIRVVATLDPAAEILPELEWLTPAGLLGTGSEGRETFLGVEAKAIGGPPPTYRLALGSGPLPPGLRLDPNTGLLSGQIGPLARDATFTFTVRATSDLLFVERAFSIQVKAVFNARPFYDVRLRLLLLDKFALQNSYRDCLPADALFHPDDPAFGLGNYDVYLLRGLDAAAPLTDAVNQTSGEAMGLAGYHHPVDLVLGEHRTAVARLSNGEVIYEVLYRPLYDPQALAGGFSFQSDTVAAEPVYYPQHDPRQQIYPASLRNARRAFVDKLGMATADPALRKVLGPTGVEGLPRWMASPQTPGDPSSVIGFIPAVLIAYLRPGQSRRVLNLIGKEKPLGFGKVYSFTRYIIAVGSPDHIELPAT